MVSGSINIYIQYISLTKSPGIFHGFSLPNWVRRLDLGISWRQKLATRNIWAFRKKKPWGFSRVKNLWPHYEWNPEKFMTPKNYLKSPMNHSRKMTHVAMTYCGAKKNVFAPLKWTNVVSDASHLWMKLLLHLDLPKEPPYKINIFLIDSHSEVDVPKGTMTKIELTQIQENHQITSHGYPINILLIIYQITIIIDINWIYW